MQMQELNEIANSMEIMGKAYIEIAKKMKNIKVRVPSSDKANKKKRDPTAYNCFVKSQVKKGANMKDIMSTLGSKWKELSAEEKKVYLDESKVHKKEQEKEEANDEKNQNVESPAQKKQKKSANTDKKVKKDTKKKDVESVAHDSSKQNSDDSDSSD